MSLQLSSVARSKFISGSFESKLNWESKDEKEMKHIEMTKRGIVLTKLKAKLLTACEPRVYIRCTKKGSTCAQNFQRNHRKIADMTSNNQV